MKLPWLVLLFVSGFAQAQPVCATPSENHPRLAFIQSHLNEDARHARLWTGAWGAGYGVLTVGQLAAVPVLTDAQADLYVGAVFSAGALAALLAQPLSVMEHSVTLDALALAHPDTVDCAVLAEAERLLVASAQSEVMGRSVLVHAASAVYNIISLLVMGLVFDRWASGITNAAVGVLIGELMILTQPTGARDTLQRYRAGEWSASRGPTRPVWNLQLAMAPSRVGLQLRVSF